MADGTGIREKDIVEMISIDRLMEYTDYLAREDRESGSPGEARAIAYFKEMMEGFGLTVNIRWIENYISLPVSASVEVISPEPMVLNGLTPSFSANTPEDGLELELVSWNPDDPRAMEGKAVFRPGLAMPTPARDMEQNGVAGQVWANWGEFPNNSTITTIWGHPLPETAHRIPKTPAVSLGRQAGETLRSMLDRGPVKVRLHTKLKTGFMQVPLATADLPGMEEPDKYVLFNGHIDSWHQGATDNGTANACILEAARILSVQREKLKRGVRFVWWSGHSQGRYSGSTWYADHHWEDLYDNAICHLNVDSLGCQGATDYSYVECSAELYELGRSVYQLYAGQTPEYDRIGHSGDNSFWGVGLPSLYQLVSHTPLPEDGRDVIVKGLAWFWHTEQDTVDKIDPEILLTDVQIYLATLWRLCTSPLLPMNFVDVADELNHIVKGFQSVAGGVFDVVPTLAAVDRFREAALALNRMTTNPDHDDSLSKSSAVRINQCLMQLSRILIPVNYSAVSRFDMDPATGVPPLPRLQSIKELAVLDRESDAFKFLHRKMIRERNRLCHALKQAEALISSTLSEIQA